MNKDDFYKNHDKIEIPICFYIDDDGNKVYDTESMRDEFDDKINKLIMEIL